MTPLRVTAVFWGKSLASVTVALRLKTVTHCQAGPAAAVARNPAGPIPAGPALLKRPPADPTEEMKQYLSGSGYSHRQAESHESGSRSARIQWARAAGPG
jgi:hypothetical protein